MCDDILSLTQVELLCAPSLNQITEKVKFGTIGQSENIKSFLNLAGCYKYNEKTKPEIFDSNTEIPFYLQSPEAILNSVQYAQCQLLHIM